MTWRTRNGWARPTAELSTMRRDDDRQRGPVGREEAGDAPEGDGGVGQLAEVRGVGTGAGSAGSQSGLACDQLLSGGSVDKMR